MTDADKRNRGIDDIALVPFTRAHLDGAVKLSQAVAWPYRIEDWDFGIAAGRGLVLERAGEVVGTGAWFPYGETAAALGMIIVSGDLQGRGLGAMLMDALLSAADGRTLLLNATAEGRMLYERRGFVPVGTILQHQGILKGSHAAAPADMARPMTRTDFDAVARLDREATGFERRMLLRRLTEVGDGWVLIENGEPAGYAISRLFGFGHVVGPVVAKDLAAARRLIEASLSRLEGRFVRIDTSVDTGLAPWLTEIGLREVGDALTMVRGILAPTGPARLFALANQSFN